MTDNNPPVDATEMHAEAVVKAAIEWRYRAGDDPVLNAQEWRLYQAANAYGDTFKGVRNR